MSQSGRTSTPDLDVMAAIVAKWLADRELPTLVPGGLVSGRVQAPESSTADTVTAHLACTESRPQVRPGGPPPQRVIDYRKVTITIRGRKTAAADVLARARWHFEPCQLNFPSELGIGCQYCKALPGSGTFQLDPSKKEGEDIWMGIVLLEVCTNRSEW